MNAANETLGRTILRRRASNRTFGIVFAAVFLFFGLRPLYHHQATRSGCLVLSGSILLTALIRPSLLGPINRISAAVGLRLSKLVNLIVTGFLFYLVFTPAAIILRWMRYDPLLLSPDSHAQTYWIPRHVSEESSDMANQF